MKSDWIKYKKSLCLCLTAFLAACFPIACNYVIDSGMVRESMAWTDGMLTRDRKCGGCLPAFSAGIAAWHPVDFHAVFWQSFQKRRKISCRGGKYVLPVLSLSDICLL